MTEDDQMRELCINATEVATKVYDKIKIIEKRNSTLFNLLRLLHWRNYGILFLNSAEYDLKNYEPKRGWKGNILPLKFVMHHLGVSHRTAQDYVKTIQALDELNELLMLSKKIHNRQIMLLGKKNNNE